MNIQVRLAGKILVLLITFLLFGISLNMRSLGVPLMEKGNENDLSNESVIKLTGAVSEIPLYDENGCPLRENQDWSVGKATGCQLSPDGYWLGKLIYNGLSFPDKYYEIMIVGIRNNLSRRVYAGDFRTLGWEWVSGNQIKIEYNCGTGCKASKVISLDQSITASDYQNGRMNKENGWAVEFANSFNKPLL